MVYDQVRDRERIGSFCLQRHQPAQCPNLPKLEPAIAQHDNGTGGDALTPQTTPRRAQC